MVLYRPIVLCAATMCFERSLSFLKLEPHWSHLKIGLGLAVTEAKVEVITGAVVVAALA